MSSALAVAAPKRESSAAPVQRKAACETSADSERQEVGVPRWLQHKGSGAASGDDDKRPRLQHKCAACAAGECAACAEEERRSLQTKLTVNAPGDIYEQEADRVADQVMAAPAPSRIGGAPQRVQRLSGDSNAQVRAAPASVDQALASPGTPLEPALRNDMEQRFGHNFSGVRVHTGSGADESARAVSARAYTVGSDIVFGRGHYAPETPAGKTLLAHELTHVLQQGGDDISPSRSADSAGATSDRGQRRTPTIGVAASATALQRDSTDDLAEEIARDLNNYVANNNPSLYDHILGDLNNYVANNNPSLYDHILEVFGKLPQVEEDIDDNVAADFTELQSDARLEQFATSPKGLAVLDVLSEAMITGSVTLFESNQAERILIAKRKYIPIEQYTAQAERIAGLRHKASASYFASEDQRISQIARDLNVYVANELYQHVIDVFDDLPSKIEDNVAAAFVESQPDASLEKFAEHPKGREMLDVLYEAMITGSVSSFESLQSERILIAKTKHPLKGQEEQAEEHYVAEAERIAALRDRAEDSHNELVVDIAATLVAHELNNYVAEHRYQDIKKEIEDLSSGILSSRIEDNVASHFVELQSPAKLKEIAADKAGREMLNVLYEAIITGKVSAFERLQGDRILEAEAETSVLTSAALTKAVEDRLIFPLATGWSSTATIVAELSDGKVKVFYDTWTGVDQPRFRPDLRTLQGRFSDYQIRTGMILDPDEVVFVRLYDQGDDVSPIAVPAIRLIDFFNQQKEDTLGKIEKVSVLAATVGVGGVGAGGILEGADTIALVISAGSLFVNAYRNQIAKTKAGRLFLEAWDVAEGIAEYYNWGRLGVDGLRLVHAKVGPALERWRQEVPSGLTSAERETIAAAQKEAEAWLGAVKKVESTEARKYLEAHPPKKVKGEPGHQHAEVEGGHHVEEASGGLGCKLYSGEGIDVLCPEEFKRREKFLGQLPAHVGPLQPELLKLLDAAEDAGLRLELDEVAAALRETTEAGAASEVLKSLEEGIQARAQVREAFGEAGTVPGGSRPGDVSAELPEGTQVLGVGATKYPKEVSAYLQRHPKIHASPDSEAALDALYAHTRSGALSVSPRAGRFNPIETRAAASELESIEELSARPEVVKIELIPSGRGSGRTVDKIIDIRRRDGSVVRARYEDTTITGAGRGYRPRGAGGRRMAEADRIVTAVTEKVTSPSQLDALMEAQVPPGGTLAVHIPRPSLGGAQDVADAMATLDPTLRNSSVKAVEFYLPGQQGLRRQVLRYVRQPNGTFVLMPAPAP